MSAEASQSTSTERNARYMTRLLRYGLVIAAPFGIERWIRSLKPTGWAYGQSAADSFPIHRLQS